MNTRCVSLVLVLLCCAAPLASAGGMAKVYLSPSEATWKTGQTVQVKVMYDNNLKPLARDISLYLDWNPEMLKYQGCDFRVGNTTVDSLLSSHELSLMLGDFTSGYKNGDYALAVLTYKVIAPGTTKIVVKVKRLTDMNGNTVTFVTGTSAYTITGTAVANPGTVTPAPRTTIPTTMTMPPVTYTLIPTVPVQTAVLPVVATTLPPALPVQPVYTAPPVVTIATTIPTTVPTTIPTTIPTTVPTTIPTTIPTTVPTTIPTTIPTTVPTTEWTTYPTPSPEPTTEMTTVPTTTYPTVVQNATVTTTVNLTPTPDQTLPSPLETSTNLTDSPALEPVEDWPGNGTPTTVPVPATVTANGLNNTSAALPPSGSFLGDLWMLVLAAAAGVALVAVGVVAVRRSRDDWL